MKLKKIGEGFSIRGKDVEIAGVTSHSKEVGHGFLFVAKRGKTHDGNQYIPDAIAAGAVAVVTDLYNPFLQVPQIIVPDVAAAEPLLAARFYEKPHEKLFLIGVTGTSGKTTTTYMIKHLLGQAGLIGSIECVIGEHRIKSHLTTPDCLTGYKWLREMVKEGLPAAVMEVSSHALLQHRVEGLLFDVVVFTNLSHEHLDYHGTMDNYRKAKERLLCQLKPNGIVIANGDDPTWSTLPNAKLYYRNEFEGFSIPFIGAHNQSNAMAAIHVARRYGISEELIKERCKTIPAVPGRLQRVKSNVFVDHAHKPEALRHVLLALRGHTKGRLITLFGCGGDRDKEKRPQMARIAEEHSDEIIVTSDNPRKEDPLTIIQEICQGFSHKQPHIEPDRKKAIALGLSLLGKKDVLLIAGKGNETTQILAHGTIPFDDAAVVSSFM